MDLLYPINGIALNTAINYINEHKHKRNFNGCMADPVAPFVIYVNRYHLIILIP